MYVMKCDGQIIGYYDSQAEAVQAMEEERKKKDGTELFIGKIEEDDDGDQSEIRY